MKNLLFSVAALGALAIGSRAADTPNGIRKAPELAFSLPGQGDKLLSQYRGKVVGLEFILTTCVHCQAASHVMSKFQQEYGSRGFQALDLAINALDNGGNTQSATQIVNNFIQQFQVAFPVGWVPRDEMMSFMGFSMAERMVVPQIVLIDRKGFIHYQTPPLGDPDSMKPEVLQQRIEELLALGNPSSHRASKAARPAAGRGR